MIRLFNTATRRKEEFVPLEPNRVKVYTCGPTVYRYAHIGNLRSYLTADWLRRLLEAAGYSVAHVTNITDVGHMRQDAVERGEDKVVAAALAEGKSPQDIAEFYTQAFFEDERKLGILPAQDYPRASDNIPAMVALAATLVEKGFAYEVSGNVYFETARFPGYGKLSRQTAGGLEAGVRAAPDPLKRDPRDFTLWKAAEPGRTLKWPSPWGDGFPGWHIECSAMVLRHLGTEIDIHTGGVDNIFPHHEDEIAQSEAALGHRHVRTWLHTQHLLVDGIKMAKSSGNTYLMADLDRRGFEPAAFRYLCATVHYRTPMNFTFASLRAAQKALLRLRHHVHDPDGRVSKREGTRAEKLRSLFWDVASDDINLAAALAVAWHVARSRLPGVLKRELLMDFDRLLGLDLFAAGPQPDLPERVAALQTERNALRRQRSYPEADALRERLRAEGYEVHDGRIGSRVGRVPAWCQRQTDLSSSSDVASLVDLPAELEFTISLVARQGCNELERCLRSLGQWLKARRAEIIVVDNGFDDECADFIETLAGRDERLRAYRADHFLGSAAGRNVALRQARGRYVICVDTSVEIQGDVFSAIQSMLSDSSVGVVGRWGVTTSDMRTFDEATHSGDVHAVEGYLMAFRRHVLREVGLLDEKYRFYRHLDLDFSFAVRNCGYRAVVDADLPVVRHTHVDWEATPRDERDRLSKRNFYRFLHKWGERTDLLALNR